MVSEEIDPSGYYVESSLTDGGWNPQGEQVENQCSNLNEGEGDATLGWRLQEKWLDVGVF